MSLFSWLRDQGVTPGLDLGNFSVGFATVCIAAVSLLVALRTGKSTSNLKTAEFRQAWIERLRSAVSSFLGTCSAIGNCAVSHHAGSDRAQQLDQSNSKLKEEEAQIRLLLNAAEEDHRLLVSLTQQMRGRAAGLSMNAQSSLAYELDELDLIVGDLTALILKNEWKRVNDDTYGRSRIVRHLRQKTLDRELHFMRLDVTQRASKFCNKPTVEKA